MKHVLFVSLVAVLSLSLFAPVGVAHGAGTHIFPSDAATLAVFELNGDLLDESGNGRDATALGTASFIATDFGSGLVLPGTDPQGFEWNAFAPLLSHPWTIEMVFTPDEVSCYQKLFGHSDTLDAGWYLCGGVRSFPSAACGPVIDAGVRQYLAFVSTSATTMDIYRDGAFLCSTDTQFTAPPGEAIFFRDDSATSRRETLPGVVDAVRISSVARSPGEIEFIQCTLDGFCSPPVPIPELSTFVLASVGLVGMAAVAVTRRRN